MSLLQMSVSGAMMILAVIIIRALAINRLPKKTFIALWGIVLLRLLVPFSFPSPFSAYSLVNQHIFTPQNAVVLENANAIPAPPVDLPTTGDVVIQGQTAASISPYVIIWGIGLIVCALFFAVSYFKCRREFQESLPIKNDFLTQWIAEHKLSRPIEIRQSSRISAPLTYGVFKPIILMPKSTKWEDTKQIEYILAHEFIHIKRFDAATKLLLTAALCIHWFNPLVWAMYILSNRDIELSCDETVVRSFGETTKSTYARTLISMEEKKSTLTPLCNNFSKNAIEERITAIMKMKKTSVIAVLVAIVLVVGVTTAFATSAASSSNSLQASYGKNFGEYERQRLNAFKFDGYENMSVTSYQQKAWVLLDTADYREVIERISQNNMLYKMRYNNNQDAAFLFNILEPLSAERWQTRDFEGYTRASNGSIQGDYATLEYKLTLNILDADKLTVGQYDKARQGVEEGLHNIFQNKTNIELQDENMMGTAIATEIAALKNKWESPTLQIAVEYSFKPMSHYENTSDYNLNSSKQEKRLYPHATKADYQSLLKLKTADYQKKSVSAFNDALLEWANEDFERSERVNTDSASNDFEVLLTDDERSFVTLTVQASGQENAKLVQSHHTGREKEDPVLGNFELTKEGNYNNRGAWANLLYQLTYHISDENKLTVGERDRALAGVINGIQAFWDKKKLNELVAIKEETFRTQLNSLATQNSNNLISIKIKNLSFQGQAEGLMDYQTNTATSPIKISVKEIARGGKISLGSQLFAAGTDCKVSLTYSGNDKLTILFTSANGITELLLVESGKAAILKIEQGGEYTFSVKNDSANVIGNVNGTIEFMQSSGSQSSDILPSLNTSTSQTVTYSNVEMRRYEGVDGHPYIHDTKINETTKKIVGCKYGMLAFDKEGNPLKIDWWSLDTEAESTYFYLNENSTEIASAETYDVFGGWSLNYFGTDSSVEKIAYVLYCDKEVTFEDGTIWTNPNFDSWRSTFEGKKIDVGVLKGYYPYKQKITFGK